VCDLIVHHRIRGRLEVCVVAIALGIPCIFLALEQPPGAVWGFAAWMLPGCMMLYVYYSGVYSAIQDVVEPALRGTAMALYFFAMYVMGASLGPFLTGVLSDLMARRAMRLAGAAVMSEQFKGAGLHHAMYLIPALCLVLAAVLFAAARAMPDDAERLRRWMRESNAT